MTIAKHFNCVRLDKTHPEHRDVTAADNGRTLSLQTNTDASLYHAFVSYRATIETSRKECGLRLPPLFPLQRPETSACESNSFTISCSHSPHSLRRMVRRGQNTAHIQG